MLAGLPLLCGLLSGRSELLAPFLALAAVAAAAGWWIGQRSVLLSNFEELQAQLDSERTRAAQLEQEQAAARQLHLRERNALHDLGLDFSRNEESEDFLGQVANHLVELMGGGMLTIYLCEGVDRLERACVAGFQAEQAGQTLAVKVPGFQELANGQTGCLELTEQPLCDQPLLRGRFPSERLTRYLALPMNSGGEFVGLMEVCPEGELDPAVLELMVMLAAVVAVVVRNLRLHRQLKGERVFSYVVLEEMEDGVFTLDAELKLATFNRAAETITGWTRQQVLGRACHEVFSQDNYGRLLEQMATGEVAVVPQELKMPVRDGVQKYIYFQPSRHESPRPTGPSLVVVFRDISKVRELENLRNDFTTTLSHELRTPLTSIKGYIHTLMHKKAEKFSSEKLQSVLAIVNHQVDRLSRLIADLLEAARLGSQALEVHPRPVRVAGLISEVIEAYREKEPGFPVSLECPDGAQVLCDPDQIRYVLEHLLSNAVKYSIPGGQIQIVASPESSLLRVAIRDEGVGIPFDQQQRIFEMYHRVDTENTRSHYGVGMGLYIAKKVIEAHGGGIEVESAPGYGSTFSFTLPLKQR
ncbi:MAG: ATP-binding protein [Vulcanimicrobiota bacterium]